MLRLGKVIFSGKTIDLLAKQQPVIMAKPEHAFDLEKLLQITKSAGLDAKIVDNQVQVIGSSDFSANLNKLAFTAGITLQTLTSIRASLEDTFFEMTGE
jgi:ABC-2 type transport system ATP-binding protein